MAHQDLNAQIQLSPEQQRQLENATKPKTPIKPGTLPVPTQLGPCPSTTITDVDGNTYNTVSIGTQCWTKENLKVTKYNDGTSIPLDASGGQTGGIVGQTWDRRTTGAYTIYNNQSSTGLNATNYGFLYNWYAAAGIITTGGSPTKNICPTGWHVPTSEEWNTLTTFLGGEIVAGGKMKSIGTAYWNSPNSNATNESGFTALPGGHRDYVGNFDHIRSTALFWSATESYSINAWSRFLSNYFGDVYRDYGSKSYGLSVRCLRD